MIPFALGSADNARNLAIGRSQWHAQVQQPGSLDDHCTVRARNICGANDLWAVNTDLEYHEEKKDGDKGDAPKKRREPAYAEPARV